MDPKRRRLLEILIFVLPFIIVAGLLAVKFIKPYYYYRFAVREDGLFEYLTAVGFLLASVLCLLSSRASRFLDNHLVSVGFLAAGVLFFLVFGEEISWGQRIIGFETPAGIANRQGELTLHNLEGVQSRLIYGELSVSFLGAFGWLMIAALPSRTRSRLAEIGVSRFIPDWYLSSYFFVTLIVASAMTYLQGPLIRLFGDALRIGGSYFRSGDQEPPEAILALGILLFAYFSYSRLKREASGVVPAEQMDGQKT